jgi:hypothetical protein
VTEHGLRGSLQGPVAACCLSSSCADLSYVESATGSAVFQNPPDRFRLVAVLGSIASGLGGTERGGGALRTASRERIHGYR